MIENVIMQGSCHEPGDPQTLWEDEPWAFSSARDLPGLLVECGHYKSTSAARRAGRDGPIPAGFTMLKASKKCPQFCVWNPTKPLHDYEEGGLLLVRKGLHPALGRPLRLAARLVTLCRRLLLRLVPPPLP